MHFSTNNSSEKIMFWFILKRKSYNRIKFYKNTYFFHGSLIRKAVQEINLHKNICILQELNFSKFVLKNLSESYFQCLQTVFNTI